MTKADLRDAATRSACWPCPASAAGPRPRLERHARQADRRRLHPRRPRELDRADGALHDDGRRRPGDGDPQRQRLRAVHRRPRLSSGRRADRRHRRARSPAASPRARRCCCATSAPRCSSRRRPTRSRSRRPCSTRAPGPRALQLQLGLFGGEPWTEEHARRDRASARAEGGQLLRAVGDVRPGRGRRVPGRHAPGCTSRRTTSWSR